MSGGAFQDNVDWVCFGCGRLNDLGLRMRSRWEGDEVVCDWRPDPHHAGYPGFLHGGVIAALIDCQCIWTAIASACRAEGVALREPLPFSYVSGSLRVDFFSPASLDAPIRLAARLQQNEGRKAVVVCSVSSEGVERARGEMVAMRVSAERLQAMQARRPPAAP